MRLVIDEAYAATKAGLTQGGRGLIAAMACTDNDHRAIRHWNSPTSRTQALPMPSPLALILACWPRPEEPALVSVPKRWLSHLSVSPRPMQERAAGGEPGASLGIVSRRLLRFSCGQKTSCRGFAMSASA